MQKLLLGAAIGVVATLLSVQTAPQDKEDSRALTPEELYLQMHLELLERSQPETSSPNWKQLTEDVGFMIQSDPRGIVTARLYVRWGGGSWRALAVEGFREFAPPVLPGG